MGITNLDNIITGSKRIESLHFGYADYAASVRMRTTNIGGPNKDYVILTDDVDGNIEPVYCGDDIDAGIITVFPTIAISALILKA